MSKIYYFLAWIVSMLWACVVWTLRVFVRIWKNCKQKDRSVNLKTGAFSYHNFPPAPVPMWGPGEEIQDMVTKKHNEYMMSDKSNAERPIIELTVKQCFQWACCTEIASRHYNSIIALGGGDIEEFAYASVRVKIKKGQNNA